MLTIGPIVPLLSIHYVHYHFICWAWPNASACIPSTPPPHHSLTTVDHYYLYASSYNIHNNKTISLHFSQILLPPSLSINTCSLIILLCYFFLFSLFSPPFLRPITCVKHSCLICLSFLINYEPSLIFSGLEGNQTSRLEGKKSNCFTRDHTLRAGFCKNHSKLEMKKMTHLETSCEGRPPRGVHENTPYWGRRRYCYHGNGNGSFQLQYQKFNN